MKKHNDGYVLPFVLVVLVVVCLVAVSLMSNSLSNLQRQQASIERMQDEYTAMGIKTIEASIKNEAASVACSTCCSCAETQGCTCSVQALSELVKKLETYGGVAETSGIYKVTVEGMPVFFEISISVVTTCSCTAGTCTCKGADGTASCSCAATATVGECTISTEEVTE